MTDSILDMDSILDGTMDNVADIPDYVDPPAGLYALNIEDAKIEEYGQDGDKKLRFKIAYSIEETIKLDATDEMPVPDGSYFTETFMATEQGMEFLKKQAKKLLEAESLEGVTIREILEELKGVQSRQAMITIRISGDQGQYKNVNVRPVMSA